MTTPTDTPKPRRRRRSGGGGGPRPSASAGPAPSRAPRRGGQATPQAASTTRESVPFDPAPLPFVDLVSDPHVLDALQQRGFKVTTPIQSAVLPYALKGHDIIGCAQTGTGKTAAYLLPILAKLMSAGHTGSHAHTRALILAPTRELATQIDDEIQGFAYHAPVASVAVYGGVPMGPQERALKAGVDIVVATPGRLLDHMRQKIGDFSRIEVLVLDEADRMMDMGFWPDVRKIAEMMPPTEKRQTMLFSATMPEEVMRFADELAPKSVFIQVGSMRGPAQTITHEARLVHAKDKAEVLAKELRRERGTSIVFVNTKIGCDRLARTLQRSGLKAAAVHADRSQKERTETIEMFRSGRVQVLVATDVAARGLDIDDVALVVNYEVPRSLDTYVHRVGRTGRRDMAGHALTLSDDFERSYLDSIDKAFGLKLFEQD